MPVKPGWKTSEFWMTLAADAVGLAAASGAFCTAHDSPVAMTVCKGIGLATIALAHLGYPISRGLAKGGAS